MDSTAIFGLNSQQIAFWTMIAEWFAAIGTLSAVIVALFLSFREKRINLKVEAYKGIILGSGLSIDIIDIRVVNKGIKDVKISGFYWKLPFDKSSYLQLFNDNTIQIQNFPIEIKEGESKSFPIRLENFERNFKEIYMKKSVFYKKMYKYMRIGVYTPVGKNFESRIGRNLRKYIMENFS